MDSIKNYILAALFISLFIPGAAAQESGTAKFNQGVTYFSAGSYKEAIQAWTEA